MIKKLRRVVKKIRRVVKKKRNSNDKSNTL